MELFPGKTSEIRLSNDKRPKLIISKRDKDTGDPVPGVTFTLRSTDGPTITTKPTGADGKIVIENLLPGVYTVTEQSVPENYILDTTPQNVTLFPNKETQVEFQNHQRPTLKIVKVDINGKHLTGALFEVKTKAGVKIGDYPVNANGEIVVPQKHLAEGYYIITEIQAPKGYILDSTPHEVYLRPGKTTEVSIENKKKPSLTIKKIDSVVGDGVKGAKFEIWVAKDKNQYGTYQKLDENFYYTDEEGVIHIDNLDTGWYKVKEVEPPAGYMLKEPSGQTVYVEHDKTAVVTFENIPKSSLIIRKIDAETGKPLVGAWFRIRYLSGTSGSGGTIIGEHQTSSNGNIILTGLEAGTYVVEEIIAPDGYVMDIAPQTAYISGKEQDCITLTFTNSKNGGLLIKKIDSVTKAPLSDVRFFVTTGDGAVVGNSGGYFTTDATGTILVGDIEPGTTLVVKEVETRPGYILDDAPQTVKIISNEIVTLEFRNQPKGGLIVRKIDSATGKPIPGVEFKITNANGELLPDNEGMTSSNGMYVTDGSGQIVLPKLSPGTYIVTETKTLDDYILDATPQTVVVNASDTQTLTFRNTPKGALVVWKYDSVTGQAVKGAVFQIKNITAGAGGNVVGTYKTTTNGSFTVTGLDAGTYVVEEIASDSGHVIDASPQTVNISGDKKEVIQLYFGNAPKGNLLIKKIDSVTHEPISGVEFIVTNSDGTTLGTGGGRYITDSSGYILVENIAPGTTLIAREVRAKGGYVLDDVPQTAVIKAGQTVELEFRNQPVGSLLIRKVCSVNPSTTLRNAEFKVAYSDGTLIGNSNGVYRSDENGEVKIDGLIPGRSVVVTETKAPTGFLIDTQSQTIVIQSGKTVSLTFKNQPKGQLIIQKRDSATNKPLPGAEFRIMTAAGCEVGLDGVIGTSTLTQNGIFTTDAHGEIKVTNLAPGAYVLNEIKAPDGYVMDTPSTNVVIGTNGDTQTVIIKNSKAGVLVIDKRDSLTNKPLAGVTFKVTTATGEYVPDESGRISSNGLYVTDKDGKITIKGVVGTLVVTETKTIPGYTIDPNTRTQTVVVNPNDTQTLHFYNTPGTTLIIRKFIEGTENEPLSGVAFKVIDGSGAAVGPDDGVYYTDKAGEIVLSDIEPGTTVIAREIKTVEGFVLDGTPQNILIKEGEVQSLTFWNKRDNSLTILKQSTGKTPLTGAVFHVTDEDGAAIGTNNGRYTTDRNGLITITGLQPGQVLIVTEEKAPNGYVRDMTPKTIKIKQGVANSLIFENARTGKLVINKYSSADRKTPLEGVTFKITATNGDFLPDENGKISSNGLYYTDSTGQIMLNSVVGSVVVTEVQTIDGYTISDANRNQTVEVKPDDTQTLYFYNDPLCSLTITKVDSVTGKPVPNTEFTVKDTNGNVIGKYTTGKDGTVTVTGLVPNRAVVVTETRVPNGYVLNPIPQTIQVKNGTGNNLTSGAASSSGSNGWSSNGNDLTFENDPKTILTIEKYLETETGNQPLKGVTFLVTASSGSVIGPNNGEYITGEDGRIVIQNLEPGATITAKEIKVPEGVILDSSPKSIQIKVGEGQTLRFINKKAGTLVVRKLDKVSKAPLAGVEFELTYAEGGYVDDANGHLSSKGRYVTNDAGEIRLSVTGTVVVKEIQARPGYVIDSDTQTQTVKVNPADTQTLTFYNEPMCSLTIKKVDSVTGKPVPNTEFTVKDSSGSVIGKYTTGKDGTVTVTGLVPNSAVVVTETKVPSGYVLNPIPQTIQVKNGAGNNLTSGSASSSGSNGWSSNGNDLTFENDPKTILTIEKYLETETGNQPLKGVTFLVTDSSGSVIGPNNGEYITGEDGRIVIQNLEPGATITAKEIKVPEGVILDSSPKSIQIKVGEGQTIRFVNKKAGTLVVRKLDKVSKAPLAGVEFELTYAEGGYVDDANGHLSSKGRYVTNDMGEIRLSVTGTVVVKEVKTLPGYVIDSATQIQTVKVNPADTQTLEFYNEPMCSLTLTKRDAVTGKPVPNTEFTLKDGNGNVIGKYTTGKDGTATVTGLVPGSTVIAVETKVPTGYVLDSTPKSIIVQNGSGNSLVSGSTVSSSGNSGSNGGNHLDFENNPTTTLIIRKFINGTANEPLTGVAFKVVDDSGAPVGPDDGVYYTNHAGEIVLNNLEPGTSVTAREIKTVDGFVLDGTPQTIKIKSGEKQQLTFWNKRAGALVIQKKDKLTGKPLAGVEFQVTDANGNYVPDENGHISSNGLYYTDTNGEIRINGVVGTLVVKETKTIAGYTIDETARTQTVTVNPEDVQTLTFYNTPGTTLIIEKYVEGTTTPLKGVTFLVTDSSGAFIGKNNGEHITDENGRIEISGLTPGETVMAKEIKTLDGYVLDGTPKSIRITEGEAHTLKFYNESLCSLTLTKRDSVTGKPVPGTEFTVKDGSGNILGRYTTGKDGTVTVTGLVPGSTVVVTETKVPKGYVLNSTPQTIIVKKGTGNSVVSGNPGSSGSTGTTGTVGGNDLTFENDPTTTLVIQKLVDGTENQPLQGVEFFVTDSSGAPVGRDNGRFFTDQDGRITISDLEPGTSITAKEVKTLPGYVLDSTPQTIQIKTGEAQTLRFYNKKEGNLVIKKLDARTKEPLAGVEFLLTYSDGSFVDLENGTISSKGLYTTDRNGQITISGVTGTITVTETKTIDGYVIEENERSQTVTVNPNDTQTLTFYNTPKQTLIIQKLVTGTADEPLAGVEFLITDNSGATVGPNNGIYKTDQYGRISLSDLAPGTVITAKETKTVDGYVLDGTPQSMEIKSGEVQTLTFYNAPIGGLELIKVSEADKTKRITGVTFEIRKSDGGLVDTVTTGDNGRVHVNLDAGDYYAVEIEAAKGFKLDATPHYFTIKDGETTTLTVTNKPFSGILIHKIDSVTRKGIYGVTFLLYDSNNTPVDQFTSDQDGYVYVDTLELSGKVFLRELENKGYQVDDQLKTVYVKPGETTEITWENTPITGQIQITKTSADYNSVNGWPAGTALPNTIFEIYDRANNLVDTIKTDKNGIAKSRPLPLGRYTVKETQAAEFYGLESTVMEAEIEFAGQIVRMAMTNKSLYTNVSITKRGYAQVMPGQSIRYDISNIANNSTTALTSFYWRDTLPKQAVRLDKIVTGTYNVQGNYKIVYKTNLSGDNYRTLADSLSTQKNYVLAASPVALGLASNECVTEFMAVFGVVPGNFRQVEQAQVHCKVLAGLAGGSQFVNQADVGGVYNGQWIMATDRWVTTVYKPDEPLPRTGY